MILTRLVIRDFGLYSDRHEFDLRPSEDAEGARPIILFGGKNGAGKTTILEAIRFCLYGQQALDLRTSTADYQAYLDKRIHHSRQRKAEEASVALEFAHMHQGEMSLFYLERSWRRTNKGIVEGLALRKDGDVQFGLGPDYWPHLAKELVPIGLADLFFFDGEQIQRLADDDQGGAGLGAALKELLGLNLIEQLEADLKVYMSRQAKGDDAVATRERLEMLCEERQRLSEDLDVHRQDKAAFQAKLDQVKGKIEQKETEIASRGGVFAERRNAAESDKRVLQARVDTARAGLTDLCAGLLPFTLAPTIGRALLDQLDAEERFESQKATHAVLQQQASLVGARVAREEFGDPVLDALSPDVRQALGAHLERMLLAQGDAAGPAANVEFVHALSTADRARIREWLYAASGSTRTQGQGLVRSLLGAHMELEEIERLLHAAPPAELLTPLLEELSVLHTRAGNLRSDLAALMEAEHRAAYELENIEREIARIEAQLQQSARREGKGALAGDVLAVLPEFRQEQLRLELTDLEAAFTDYFNRLARKTGFVSHAIINEQDFTMTLVSNEGRYIPKSRLSTGEKQIYAIALLWALRAVAARPLPVVIDTPLGRLDSSHRQNLVEQYFPNASHQVIILSTDTEIDATYFADLEPYLSRAYHLVYDDETGTTHAEEGYFWQPVEEMVVEVEEKEPVHAS